MLILQTAIVLQQNKFIPFVKVFWLESAKKKKRRKNSCAPFSHNFFPRSRCQVKVMKISLILLFITMLGQVAQSLTNVNKVRVYSTYTYLLIQEVMVFACPEPNINLALNRPWVAGTSVWALPGIGVNGAWACPGTSVDAFAISTRSFEFTLAASYDVCRVFIVCAYLSPYMTYNLVQLYNGATVLATINLGTSVNTYRVVTCATGAAVSCSYTAPACTMIACTNAANCNNRATSFSGTQPLCTCTCPATYTGSACQTPVPCTNADCNSRATSWSGNRPTCTCVCSYDWAGTVCQTAAACTNVDCNSRATSFSGSRPTCTCVCSYDWTGTACQTAAPCTNADCNSRATSFSGSRPTCTCVCSYDWTGTACQTAAPCTNADCNSRAASFSGSRPTCTCVCSYNWTDTACQTAAACTNADCNSQAVAWSGVRPSGCTCSCNGNWSGPLCSTPIPCGNVDCSNHSTSFSGLRPSGCTCVCSYNWTGGTCASVAPCTNEDCNHAAFVFNGLRPYCTCICRAAYRGVHCQLNATHTATPSISPSKSPTPRTPTETTGTPSNSRNVTVTLNTPSRSHSPSRSPSHSNASSLSSTRSKTASRSPTPPRTRSHLTISASRTAVSTISVELSTTASHQSTASKEFCTVVVDCSQHAYSVTGFRPSCACNCSYGWRGVACAERDLCDMSHCNYHAATVSGVIPNCNCTCTRNWTGTTCALAAPCTAEDCTYHSVAVSGRRPSCSCTCSYNWTGGTCAAAADCTLQDCTYHASTVWGLRPLCGCQCTYDWTGPRCQYAAACTNLGDCSNRATAVSGLRPSCSCECSFLYAGPRCSLPANCTIFDDCSSHAEAVNNTRPFCQCSCEYEWTGEACESPAACTTADDCSGHASSVTGERPTGCTCQCQYDWAGAQCERPADCTNEGDCHGHADVVSGSRPQCTCSCSKQWTGARCNLAVTTCPSVTVTPASAVASSITGGTLVVNVTIPATSNNTWMVAPTTAAVFTTGNSHIQEPQGLDFTVNKSNIRCSVVLPSVLQCRFPESPQYQLLASEIIAVQLTAPNLFVLRCNLVQATAGEITVTATSPDMLAAAIASAGLGIAGATGLNALLLGGGAYDVQAVILLFQSNCASTLDRDTSRWMTLIVAPASFISPLVGLAGNAGLSLFVLFVQFMVYAYVRKSRNQKYIDAAGAVRFPSISFNVIQALYIGVAFLSVSLLSGTAMELGVGAAGLIYCLGVFAFCLWLIRENETARFVLYSQFLSLPAYRRWLLPTGYWDTEPQRRAYRSLMGHCKNYRRYRGLYPLMFCLLFSVCAAVLPGAIPCGVRFVLLAAVSALFALFVIVSRPHRLPFVSVFAASSLLVLSATCMLMFMALRAPSDLLENLKLYLMVLQMVLTLLRSIGEVAVSCFESDRWRTVASEQLGTEEMMNVTARPLLSEMNDNHDDVIVIQQLPLIAAKAEAKAVRKQSQAPSAVGVNPSTHAVPPVVVMPPVVDPPPATTSTVPPEQGLLLPSIANTAVPLQQQPLRLSADNVPPPVPNPFQSAPAVAATIQQPPVANPFQQQNVAAPPSANPFQTATSSASLANPLQQNVLLPPVTNLFQKAPAAANPFQQQNDAAPPSANPFQKATSSAPLANPLQQNALLPPVTNLFQKAPAATNPFQQQNVAAPPSANLFQTATSSASLANPLQQNASGPPVANPFQKAPAAANPFQKQNVAALPSANHFQKASTVPLSAPNVAGATSGLDSLL